VTISLQKDSPGLITPPFQARSYLIGQTLSIGHSRHVYFMTSYTMKPVSETLSNSASFTAFVRVPVISWLRHLICLVLAMAGILIDKVSPNRVAVWLLIALNLLMTTFYRSALSASFIVGFFVMMFVVRYGLLFASFGPHGLARKWIRRMGEQRAYERYENLTALLFFFRGTSFTLLVEQTGDWMPVPDWLKVIGWCLVLVATVVNIWSTWIVGVDVYYYKDMFVERATGHFEKRGPFAWLSNPMYGIGQGNAYGIALLAGSVWGLAASLLNQLTMYLFYFLFEKPHIQRLFGPKKGQPVPAPLPS